MTDVHAIARDQLQSFISRIERLEEEKQTIADDIKDVYGEAKGTGFDTKILKKVIAIRKQDKNERAEQEAILDVYLVALGMIDAPFEREEQNKPETANEMDRSTKSSFETGSGEAENARKAMPETERGDVTHAEAGESPVANSQNIEIDPNEDRQEAQSDDGNADANTGGNHEVNRSAERASSPVKLGADEGVAAAIPENPKFINERCQRPTGCKHAHSPYGVTCADCVPKKWKQELERAGA